MAAGHHDVGRLSFDISILQTSHGQSRLTLCAPVAQPDGEADEEVSMQERMRRGCLSMASAVAVGAAIWAAVTVTGVAQPGKREPYTWPRARTEARAHGFPLDDTAFVRFPLPASESAYAGINGEHIKTLMKEVVAISLKSKADGNKWWGRIAGTKYDQ